MHSLRTRLLLSHILPLVVIFPLLAGIVLYLVETQVILEQVTGDISRQATLIEELSARDPAIWTDAAIAQAFVDQSGDGLIVRLLEPNGEVIATNQDETSSTITLTSITQASLQDGETIIERSYHFVTQASSVMVAVPVYTPEQDLLGIIQVTHQLGELQTGYNRIRILIIATFVIAFVVALSSAWLMALRLEKRLQRVVIAIEDVASGSAQLLPIEENIREFDSVLGAVTDLSERLHTMEETRQKLLANLVHELGRPLGALQAATHALLGGADQDPALRGELLTGMNEQIDRFKPLLDNLAGLYQQVLGPLALDPQPTQLADWLPGMLVTWQAAAEQKGLTWAMTLPDDVPPLALDQDRMAQAIGNLVSNAIKYTPEGGQVTVAVVKGDDTVGIQIADTGIGISEQERAKIFEPFYRGPETKRFPQGLGLGLAIAHDLVKAHSGRITVETGPGSIGTVFTIWLPIEPASGGTLSPAPTA